MVLPPDYVFPQPSKRDDPCAPQQAKFSADQSLPVTGQTTKTRKPRRRNPETQHDPYAPPSSSATFLPPHPTLVPDYDPLPFPTPEQGIIQLVDPHTGKSFRRWHDPIRNLFFENRYTIHSSLTAKQYFPKSRLYADDSD